MDKHFITIPKGKIFKLVKELKEFRKDLEKEPDSDLKRHDLKIKINTLNALLKEGGLDSLLAGTMAQREKLKLKTLIKNEED